MESLHSPGRARPGAESIENLHYTVGGIIDIESQK